MPSERNLGFTNSRIQWVPLLFLWVEFDEASS